MSELRRILPNAITLGRLALALVFFVMMARLEPHDAEGPGAAWFAVGVFVVAALSDVLDGFLARRWNVVTGLGRVLDPAVDKILVIGGLIYLASEPLAPTSGVAPWMVVLVVGREFLVTSIRAVVESSGGRFGADWTGKSKMFLQCVAVPIALGQSAIEPLSESPQYRLLATSVIWAMVVVTALSVLPAIVRGRRALSTSGARR
ncbi:MAG: CDP-diacylglycerol--glycerol-3-phosphate 3-phosphatidyltransferase [Phycisphaerales bacterium]|nr:CDP-diacylglycerol--glycerol-3-phosphate 3-phosphatidyltransferase [Phycisphaerales bacterium]